MSGSRFNSNKMHTGSAVSLLFDYGIDYGRRRIWLVEDISDTEFEAVAKAVRYFNEDEDQRHKPIEVIICSNGGCVEIMFAFYDLFRCSESPIHTIICGTAASAACLVSMCGHKRYATENSYMMHHSSKAFSDDLSEKEMESRASIIKSMSDRTYKLLAAHSYMTEAWWRKGAQEDGEVWLNAEEMLKLGIIDGIIHNIPAPKMRKPRKPRKRNGKQAAEQKKQRQTVTKACKR